MNPSKNNLYRDIKNILQLARNNAVRAVNFSMVVAYWQIGKRIVEEEQGGKKRAEFGKAIIKDLSIQLSKDFGKGFDESNLRYMRLFFQAFPIRDALRHELSWTHYRMIMKVENEDARNYYMQECIAQNWSSRTLERQINALYFERILSSKNKKALSKKSQQEAAEDKPSILDFVKDPYILEFLQLNPNAALYEKELETELLNKLQLFLLELGKGFSFVARQHRISADNEHFFIDLVFYNYILKCFVLIDLKVGKLTHQDIGQMDLYVRYYEDQLKQKTDNPTIGLILCTEKNETVVKYSVLKESKQLFASKYKLYLPTEKELIAELNAEMQQLKNKKLK
jgi:predicted nuclease of restriction endonuclease-like (RecB) superfamily